MGFVSRSIVLVLVWTSGVQADSVEKWLMRINDAAHNLNYEGIFVYSYGSTLEAMRVIHQIDAGGVKERIYSLNGSPREIIRDEAQVWCYAPEQKMGVHEFRDVSAQNFPNILPQKLGKLPRNYELSLGRASRVADRAAQQILIVPLDEFRYGYALWADIETGLLLKATLVDRDHNTVEQYMFTQVMIGVSIPQSALEPLTPKEDLKWFSVGSEMKKTEHVVVEQPRWKVDSLPSGFTVSRQIMRQSPIRKNMMEHYVYSDGLAAVSVFIEMIGDNTLPQINGISRMGAVHAFGHAQDGYHITVVGEVPSATVDMMGMSVSRVVQ